VNKKTYFRYLIGAITLFLSYHLIIWIFFTSKIFGLDDKHSIGDLARMSYQIDMLYKRELKYTLPKSFIYKDIYKGQKIDIVTIGDSFSHGGGGGENPYYQDYLASYYNKNVLNIDPEDPYDFFATAVGLYKSGFLEKSHTKYLIIQSVERFFPRRFAKDLNISKYPAVQTNISNKTFKIQHLDVPLISTANYKVPYYTLLYYFKENAKKDVHKVSLTKNLFSHDINNKMLFLHGDVTNIPQFTIENIHKINTNFNTLAKLLSSINIKLIVFPTPDKYDLYSKYIQNNKHIKNPFYLLMQKLEKNYTFIDSKAILEKSLNNGVKDLYFPDDTHWTYKASKTIIQSDDLVKLFKVN